MYICNCMAKFGISVIKCIIVRSTSYLGEVRNVEITRVSQQLPYSKSHDILVANCRWHVGFENGMKMAPIFTISFISKMLI